jgi:hypothetical protein
LYKQQNTIARERDSESNGNIITEEPDQEWKPQTGHKLKQKKMNSKRSKKEDETPMVNEDPKQYKSKMISKSEFLVDKVFQSTCVFQFNHLYKYLYANCKCAEQA